MLGQGTNRLNRGYGYDGSGWGSERTGLVPAWWRLTEGSVRAAALAAEYGREQLRQSAAAELELRASLGAQGKSAASLGEVEGEVTIWLTPPPPPPPPSPAYISI